MSNSLENRRIFSEEYVNTGRQLEMDIFKGIAIIFMTLSHVFEMHATDEQYYSTAGFIIDNFIAGPPGAATFMTIMGVGLWYSAYNKGDRKSLLEGYIPGGMGKRGIILLVLGFVIAFFRSIFMPALGYLLSGDGEVLSYLGTFFIVDIYQFAGLSLLIFEVFHRLHAKYNYLVITAVVFSIIGTILRGKTLRNTVLNTIATFLWGTSENACFTLFNWFVFPVFGFVLAKYIARCSNKARLYVTAGPISVVIYLIYTFICLKYDIGYASETQNNGMNFYWCTTIDVFFYMITVLGVLGICYGISRAFSTHKFTLLRFWSKNIIPMYSFQWILVALSCGIEVIFDCESISILAMCLIAVVIVAMCDLIVRSLNSKRKRRTVNE